MSQQSVLKAIAIAVVAVACAMAQSTGSATLQGVVKDSTGAVIVKAKVTSTHIETGVKASTTSNNDGFFVFPPTQIGNYKVRCEAPGMKAWEQDILLETGKTSEVAPVLTLGDVTQTVMVTDTSPLVTTTEPTDSTTLETMESSCIDSGIQALGKQTALRATPM